MFARDGVSVPGAVSGGAGRDAVEYPAYTRAVFVDLSLGRATGVSGPVSGIEDAVGSPQGDDLAGTSGANLLDGSGGADRLRGFGGDDILVGGDGDDDVFGGDGRDVAVGGFGADELYGDGGDDIVLAGPVDLAPAGIRAVAAEWSRTDRDYAQRIAALRNGGGLNGQVVLVAPSIVRDDSSVDRLAGGAAADWFWFGAADVPADRDQAVEEAN